MEVYTLDNQLRRISVIDRFESLIWTDRQRDVGDFELVVHSSSEMRGLLSVGTRLALNETDRVMTVETVERKDDASGRSVLNVSGRSLEQTLSDRVAMDGFQGITLNPNWVITDTPGNIARKIFTDICVTGTLSAADKIPFITAGTFYPADTIAEPTASITVTLDPTSVYEAIKNICDAYGLGFRLVRRGDQSKLYFNIYTGNNRTTQQTYFPAVVFSPDLDSLSDITELTSSSNFKNVAYVFAKNGALIVYANGFDATSASGLDRHAMVVNASIDDAAGAGLTAKLQQAGLDALAKQQNVWAFDGEIPQNGSYKYKKDYDLGDLVEIRTDDGTTNLMRVTEQIFVSDSEGDRSYPTLTLDQFIMPGTWFAWDYAQVWDDAPGFWQDA